ncbi:hypothetical protein F1188_11080 [Roseospira marina]|uniref:Uncharacterized protein n=1 Tax=Roseospira marina TaxID=140057 RepID=A0A5M6IBV5_9PROT|nr:hypothetical protein [Roseospira marina]KAA5605437.1 hypothetical protein F1188_11080 [Roseospira marina]MBB4314568.1 hypothetical protein [Roseospira marina]MBB5088870.1 hypothetical protein [Roseospira marina]
MTTTPMLTAATAPGTHDWIRFDRPMQEGIVTIAITGTATVQIEGSDDDGATAFAMGDAISAEAGLHTTRLVRLLDAVRARVVDIAPGGSVTTRLTLGA